MHYDQLKSNIQGETKCYLNCDAGRDLVTTQSNGWVLNMTVIPLTIDINACNPVMDFNIINTSIESLYQQHHLEPRSAINS